MQMCVYLHPQSQAKVAQLVERNLAKVEVASSNLVFRSNRNPSRHFRKGFLLFRMHPKLDAGME